MKAADAYVTMQNGRDTMMMEIGIFTDTFGADELLRTYEQDFVSTLRARPHWGLDRNHLRSETQVAALFPEWGPWKDAYEHLNPRGVFDGRLTDRLGISRR